MFKYLQEKDVDSMSLKFTLEYLIYFIFYQCQKYISQSQLYQESLSLIS